MLNVGRGLRLGGVFVRGSFYSTVAIGPKVCARIWPTVTYLTY
jgi:hypothetical protein